MSVYNQEQKLVMVMPFPTFFLALLTALDGSSNIDVWLPACRLLFLSFWKQNCHFAFIGNVLKYHTQSKQPLYVNTINKDISWLSGALQFITIVVELNPFDFYLHCDVSTLTIHRDAFHLFHCYNVFSPLSLLCCPSFVYVFVVIVVYDRCPHHTVTIHNSPCTHLPRHHRPLRLQASQSCYHR